MPEHIDGISVDPVQRFRGSVGARVCLKIEEKSVCLVTLLCEDECAFDLLGDRGSKSLVFLIRRNIAVWGAETTATPQSVGTSVRAGKTDIDAKSPDMFAIAGLETLGLPVDAWYVLLVARCLHGGPAFLLC